MPIVTIYKNENRYLRYQLTSSHPGISHALRENFVLLQKRLRRNRIGPVLMEALQMLKFGYNHGDLLNFSASTSYEEELCISRNNHVLFQGAYPNLTILFDVQTV
jgi:hypothetical protein